MNQQWLCCYKQHIYGYKDTFTPKVVAVRLQLKEVCGCNYIIWYVFCNFYNNVHVTLFSSIK